MSRISFGQLKNFVTKSQRSIDFLIKFVMRCYRLPSLHILNRSMANSLTKLIFLLSIGFTMPSIYCHDIEGKMKTQLDETCDHHQ